MLRNTSSASRECVGDDGEREGITNLKLQKMLYFEQVYFLATLNRPLFSGRIEAWEYGPVVPCIYRQYKKNGSNPIISEKYTSTLSDEDKKEMRQVWRLFGGYSASRLISITHANDPWKDAYKRTNKTITHKSLTEYYMGMFA